ncbi:hypothetical protein ACVIGB_000747 [Bradyrhizobium sp. USDA 4341]
MDTDPLVELENLASLMARGQLTQPRKTGARINKIVSELRASNNRHRRQAASLETLVKKIASFPLEDQNAVKRDDDVIYALNLWRLTVGDVREARNAILSSVPDEQPSEDSDRTNSP